MQDENSITSQPNPANFLSVLGELYRQQLINCLQQMANPISTTECSTSPPLEENIPEQLRQVLLSQQQQHLQNSTASLVNSTKSAVDLSLNLSSSGMTGSSHPSPDSPAVVSPPTIKREPQVVKPSKLHTSVSSRTRKSSELQEPRQSHIKRARTSVPCNAIAAQVSPPSSEVHPAESSRLLPSPSASGTLSPPSQLIAERKNYKNLNPGRRKQANARERDRVQNIGRAFDQLRDTIPAYSLQGSQKLSKLAVLRIACSYIRCLTEYVRMPDETLEKIRSGTQVPPTQQLYTSAASPNTADDHHSSASTSSQCSLPLNCSSVSEEEPVCLDLCTNNSAHNSSTSSTFHEDRSWMRFQQSALELGQRIREESKQRMSI